MNLSITIVVGLVTFLIGWRTGKKHSMCKIRSLTNKLKEKRKKLSCVIAVNTPKISS